MEFHEIMKVSLENSKHKFHKNFPSNLFEQLTICSWNTCSHYKPVNLLLELTLWKFIPMRLSKFHKISHKKISHKTSLNRTQSITCEVQKHKVQ